MEQSVLVKETFVENEVIHIYKFWKKENYNYENIQTDKNNETFYVTATPNTKIMIKNSFFFILLMLITFNSFISKRNALKEKSRIKNIIAERLR